MDFSDIALDESKSRILAPGREQLSSSNFDEVAQMVTVLPRQGGIELVKRITRRHNLTSHLK
jgi:hypothetical protein